MLFQCDFLAFFLCGFLNILVFSGEPIDFGSIFGRFLTFSAGNLLILSIFGSVSAGKLLILVDF